MKNASPESTATPSGSGDADASALLVLLKAGRYAEAEPLALALTDTCPRLGFAWKALGGLRIELGRSAEALEPMARAAALLPDDAGCHSNLGLALSALGRLDEAQASYRRALQIDPDFVQAHNNLGLTLKALGRPEEAARCYRRALTIQPDFVNAHNNLGVVLHSLTQFDAAERSLRRALEIDSACAEAHNNLGLTLHAVGRLAAAQASCLRATQIRPNYAQAFNNLGAILKDLGRLVDAQSCYRQALAIDPQLADAHNNLGIALTHQGHIEEALACYHRALAIDPQHPGGISNLLFSLNYHPDRSADDVAAQYRAFDRDYGQPHRASWQAPSKLPLTGRRLRVGYASPDFCRHPCQHFLEPLLAHHDRQSVEVYAYAELDQEDHVTTRYRQYADHWVPTKGLSDDDLARRIRADAIDILVDLAGHTRGNRLMVFARKPAPVSVSWLGFGYSTGLTAIDYYLTDAHTVPVGAEALFSELPWRMDRPSLVFRPSNGMGRVSPLPALGRPHLTFCTLTRAVRINHHTIRVWSQILHRVPGSLLVINSSDFRAAADQQALTAQFARHGIDAARLRIGYQTPPWDVLRDADIALDCFPHNSGTTLFESLYMGLPFVTLCGRPSVGRLGAAILQGLGRPQWIAQTEDDYVQIAVDLAGDLVKLSQIRHALRDEMQVSTLMDEPGFARGVEAAFRAMVDRSRSGGPATATAAPIGPQTQ